MTVYDLNDEQMDELKMSYFYSDDVDEEIIGDIEFWWDIPDDVIYDHYGGICFVEEDFSTGG